MTAALRIGWPNKMEERMTWLEKDDGLAEDVCETFASVVDFLENHDARLTPGHIMFGLLKVVARYDVSLIKDHIPHEDGLLALLEYIQRKHDAAYSARKRQTGHLDA